MEVGFRAEAAAEFDEGVSVVVLVTVEDLIDPALEAALEGLEDLGGDEDGEDEAEFTDGFRQIVVYALGDEGDDAEIDGDECAGGQGVGDASFEDEVGVHEPVADDGPTESERQEDEGEAGELLQKDGNGDAGEVGDGVKECEGQNGEQGSAGEPLKLLPEQGGVGSGIAAQEEDGGEDKIGGHVGGGDLVELEAKGEGGLPEHDSSDAETDDAERGGVDER